MKKIKKKTIKNRLDKLWSILVKKNGVCEICGNTEHLNSHHVIGRRCLNTRWDLKNGCSLCPGCHTFKNDSAHQNPLFFLAWFKKARPDDLKYLNEKRKEVPRPFSVVELLAIEEELKTLIK